MRSLILVLCAVVGFPAYAKVVEVTGSAPIVGAVSHARDQAMQDALRLASLQVGSKVTSTQTMNRGVIEQDNVQLRTSAQLKNVEILWEDNVDGVYQITIRAEAAPEAMCATSKQHYRKAVAVAGFGLAHPQQASVGRLQNIEQDLPRELIQGLNNRGAIHALDATRVSLYQAPRRAPSQETAQQRLTTSVALATEFGAQYVVSGVVRDIAMAGEQGEDIMRAGSWRERLGLPPKAEPRQFVMDVFVHDGLSGAILYQKTYSTEGKWNRPLTEVSGFGTPQFWETDYGHSVGKTVSQAVSDVNELLRCQPFMARIIQARGNRLHIEANAAAGIRPGDKFQVYRTGTFYNLDLESRTELTNMATEIVIKQVQPQFVIAEMKLSAEHLAIQRDDMVIAW